MKSIHSCAVGILAAACVLGMLAAPSAQAQMYSDVYKFCPGGYPCTDGENPLAALIRDANGNLYGTTEDGGAYLPGAVFKVTPSGKETVLYSFCPNVPNCTDGADPESSLIFDTKGDLYGTTSFGGSANCGNAGCGTVFTLTPSGQETVLHSFTGPPDAWFPGPGTALVFDTKGNLYGTTATGGVSDRGAVFMLTPSGQETVLYSFCSESNCADGGGPSGNLVFDNKGNLYGTTGGGGTSGFGTVFKLTPAGKETVLYGFTGYPNDGEGPNGIVADAKGNLYGTTAYGGNGGGNVMAAFGTVFKLTSSGKESVLHNFTGSPDGANPYAGLVLDPKGNLYGTTAYGGAYGSGTVFELSGATETLLYSFCKDGSPCPDGTNPMAGLIIDKGGLYGTTQLGGNSNCNDGQSCGVVFKVTP